MTYPGPAESHIELNQESADHEIPEIIPQNNLKLIWEATGAILQMKLGIPV
jgi:hypothetical protein